MKAGKCGPRAQSQRAGSDGHHDEDNLNKPDLIIAGPRPRLTLSCFIVLYCFVRLKAYLQNHCINRAVAIVLIPPYICSLEGYSWKNLNNFAVSVAC